MNTDPHASSGEPALELQGLSKSFGGLRAVRDVTLKVMPGDRTELGDLQIEVLEAERFRVRWVIVQTQMPKTEADVQAVVRG